MSSKAGKLRGKLGSFAREREEFEQKKKELQEQMNKEKQNMGKIRKGLRGNDLKIHTHETDDGGGDEEPMANRRMKSTRSRKAVNTPTEHSNTIDIFAKVPPIPSGPKISDWAYTGSSDSAPPVVKQQELYEEVRFLGRGAYGTVDLVKNREDNRLFASKTLLLQNKTEEAEFMHEVEFLRTYRHPFIVHLHDVFMSTHPKKVFIVMHYCGGGDLGKTISMAEKSRTPIPEGQVLKWISQIGLALSFLHSAGIAHRDIKPVNALLSDNGEVAQLGDFGLAVEMSKVQGTGPGAEVGTPYYTSPEMISNGPCTLASDNWAFGVLIFETLSLQLPFDGGNTVELVRSILNEPPNMSLLPKEIYSPEIFDVIAGLLIKEPSERLTVDQALKHHALCGKVASLPGMYRPKHIEERLRRYHVRQMTHQLEVLAIHPSTARATPKPKLETLESGHEFDISVSVSTSVSARSHHEDKSAPSSAKFASAEGHPPVKHHPPAGSSASHHHHHQHFHMPEASQSAKTPYSVTADQFPGVPIQNVSTHSESHLNVSFPSHQQTSEDYDDQDIVVLAERQLSVQEEEEEGRDADIHRHGVGAIDMASKYLQKHHLDKPNSQAIDESERRGGSPRVSPRMSPRAVLGGNSSAPSDQDPSIRSPRATNISSAAPAPPLLIISTDNTVNGCVVGPPLMSSSACPSPHPFSSATEESDVIFPSRSRSEGVAAFVARELTIAADHSAGAHSSLPPLTGSRPASACSTTDVSPPPIFSGRKVSPRASLGEAVDSTDDRNGKSAVSVDEVIAEGEHISA